MTAIQSEINAVGTNIERIQRFAPSAAVHSRRRLRSKSGLAPASQHAETPGILEVAEDTISPLRNSARQDAKEMISNTHSRPPWAVGADVKRVELGAPDCLKRIGRIVRSKELARLASLAFHSDSLVTSQNTQLQHRVHEESEQRGIDAETIRGILRRPGSDSSKKPGRIAWSPANHVIAAETFVTNHKNPALESSLWYSADLVVDCNRCSKPAQWENVSTLVGAPGRSHFAQWWVICRDCAARNPFLSPPKKRRRNYNTSWSSTSDAEHSLLPLQSGVVDALGQIGIVAIDNPILTVASTSLCSGGFSSSVRPTPLCAHDAMDLTKLVERLRTGCKPTRAVEG